MYLHLGDDLIVPFSEIVLIMNCETAKFGGKEKNSSKSIVIAEVDKKTVVYCSDINSKTLLSRFECFFKGDSKDVNGI